MKTSLQATLFSVAVAGIVLIALPKPSASAPQSPHSKFVPRGPHALPSNIPAPRVGVAVPQPDSVPSPGTLVVQESFQDSTTPTNEFPYIGQTCLTAGSSVVQGSVPPCGNLAPKDQNGSGALENTDNTYGQEGWVAWGSPLSTALGLQISFTIFSFNGNGSDGQLLFVADAANGPPKTIGRWGGNLGYAPGDNNSPPGLQGAYLGMGFDESGQFSQNAPSQGLPGGSQNRVPETITVRGAQSTQYYYLGGALNAQGIPSSLPFDWDQPSSPKRPANGPTVFVTLSPTGYLSCAVDIHDGNGFITYYAQSIVGVQGEPAVPAMVYVGVTGANGEGVNRHQIENLSIWQG